MKIVTLVEETNANGAVLLHRFDSKVAARRFGTMLRAAGTTAYVFAEADYWRFHKPGFATFAVQA